MTNSVTDFYVELDTGEVIDAERFIAGSGWRLARSADHEYTVRDLDDPERSTCLSGGSFEWFISHTREHGYRERFAGRWYAYFAVDDWIYWTMGLPVEETTIINRRAR